LAGRICNYFGENENNLGFVEVRDSLLKTTGFAGEAGRDAIAIRWAKRPALWIYTGPISLPIGPTR
jgi:hypothetical protein